MARQRAAAGLLLACALAGGLALDLWVDRGPASVGGTVAVGVFAVALVVSWSVLRPTVASRVLLGLAVVVAVFLPMRASPWLVPLNVTAVVLLTIMAGAHAASGWPQGSFAALARRITGVVVPTVGSPLTAAQAIVEIAPPAAAFRGNGTIAAARGLVITAPLVLVVGLLLASSDGVFASYFTFDVSLDQPIRRAAFVGIGALGLIGVHRHGIGTAFTSGDELSAPTRPRRISSIEAGMVLGGFVVVFAAFTASQVHTALRGEQYVLDRSGLTYAAYARSGFFQLLWAAGITLVALLNLRPVIGRASAGASGRLVALGLVTSFLTVAVVASSIRKLALYSDAYGLTMLRLYSALFALWLGVVFVLVAATLVRRTSVEWLAPASLGLALALLLGLNVANPEAIVARTNLARARVDVAHLVTSLSDDAVPELVARFDGLSATDQAIVRTRWCPVTASRKTGLHYNRSRERARAGKRAVCRSSSASSASSASPAGAPVRQADGLTR